MIETIATTWFFVVFKGKHIALALREEFEEWDLVRGIFRGPPSGEHVQMMPKVDLFDEITVRTVRKIDLVFLDCPILECIVTDPIKAKDSRRVRFWSGIALTTGLRLSNAAEAAISLESVRDRLSI